MGSFGKYVGAVADVSPRPLTIVIPSARDRRAGVLGSGGQYGRLRPGSSACGSRDAARHIREICIQRIKWHPGKPRWPVSGALVRPPDVPVLVSFRPFPRKVPDRAAPTG